MIVIKMTKIMIIVKIIMEYKLKMKFKNKER